MEKTDKQIDLERKINNLNGIRLGAGLAGNVAGLVYAISTGKKFWGRVGYFFLGGMITGVPTYLATMPKENKIKAELEKEKQANE